MALRAYSELQRESIDVRLYSEADNLVGSLNNNGVADINTFYNSTVADAMCTLIHEARHARLLRNTGNKFGLRGGLSGEYSARALEFFYQKGVRPNAAQRAAIQQEILELGY